MDITECREQIDRINNEILRLFTERMKISESVAEYKFKNNIPIFDPIRETAILDAVAKKTTDEYKYYARVLYTVLMDLSRVYQAKCINAAKNPTRVCFSEGIYAKKWKKPELFPTHARVACQGLNGAYSQMACDTMFKYTEKSYFQTFEDVFAAVECGEFEFGVLPIENSTYGTVTEVYDLMKRYSFNIVRSVKMKIQHCMLVNNGAKIEDIREVYSHSQALGQCAQFLRNNPQIEVFECKNTAIAAKKVADSGSQNIAAIASESCAKIYGLEKIDLEIQNNNKNFTRFICISNSKIIYPFPNKISIMFTLQHVPSALYNVLTKFVAYDLNITKIESRPIEGSDFEVCFYFDFDGSTENPNVLKLLDSMQNECESFNFLGSYFEV